MSRHSRFYNDVKHGEYDDEYDDYDDYYDEEDAYEDDDSKVANKTKPTEVQAVSSVKTGLDANGIHYQEPDYDFLVQGFSKVRAGVGPMIPSGTIIDAMRNHAYDVGLSIKEIKDHKISGARKTIVIASKHVPDEGTGGVGSSQMSREHTSDNTVLQQNSNSQRIVAATSAPVVEYVASTSAADAQGKEGLTIVITGHVDSGKSTILGHLLLQRGYYSNNDVKKNEMLGSASGKANFKYAWLLDQSEEERRRGVTIDSGAHGFETETKRVTVLDAPGHIDFITNMISSASQADAALLVVTVRNGEFESGLEKGTREHLVVLHTLGIRSLIIAMNKMDTVDFSQERFEAVKAMLMVEIHAAKYDESNIKAIVPVSGLLGIHLVQAGDERMPWYTGPSLFEAFDKIVVGDRFINSPTRLSVQDVQKNVVFGRIESGSIKKGDKLLFIPSNTSFTVKSITLQAGSVTNEALAGTSVELSLSEEALGISAGDVACSPKFPVPYSNEFDAQISVSPSAKKAILPGARFLLCIHSSVVSATIMNLKSRRMKDGSWASGMIKALPPDSQAIVRVRTEKPLALEKGDGLRVLGVFLMRQEDETIGGGLVKEVYPQSL